MEKQCNLTVTEEASKMLESALQQIDGIISNTGGQCANNCSSLSYNERSQISADNVLSTARTLALALQQVGIAAPAPDRLTGEIISNWLEAHITRKDGDEQLQRLQRDKEALALQYQTLSERLSEQADKMIELERILTEKTQLLCQQEEQIQRQMVTSSALETQKLELMSALSELKLHRAALECEQADMQQENIVTFGSVGNLRQRNLITPVAGNSPKTPPSALRSQMKPKFHSLPRTHGSVGKKSTLVNNNNNALDANGNTPKRNVAFASTERILIDDSNGAFDTHNESIQQQETQTNSPKLRARSARGFRSIFNKLRRSNSGNLETPAIECPPSPIFKRGGMRATAAGRIEWSSRSTPIMDASNNYQDWTPQEVCNWLIDLGLGCYEESCRKWLKANPNISFFTASATDIEKELNLKTPLHRKKICMAIEDLLGKEYDEMSMKAAQLDVNWVLRWLDDIGLPQYKDNFLQAKVDGRMLHRLTLEDVANLNISSCLHIASLRCGIQCMRGTNWDPDYLIRRSAKPMPREDNTSEESITEANDCIAFWTAHRVMEWLRVVDLSEYAPNLRGAGIHGALMLYEQRFNAELLADLLSIPPTKSLLRRHLATHFKELLGRDVIQSKRDAEAAPGYQALTISSKMKPPKKNQFSLKRRKSCKGAADIDWTDYVCPMSTENANMCDTKKQHENSLSSTNSTNNSSSNQSNEQ